HAALGKLNMNGGEGYISTGYEFSLAWKNREKFSDMHEKFIFYSRYIKYLLYKHKPENRIANEKDLLLCLEIAKEASMIDYRNYDVILGTAEAQFLLYRFYQSKMNTPENRLKIENLMNQTGENLEKTSKIRHQDSELQRLLILYNFDRLESMKKGMLSSQATTTESEMLKKKIEMHEREYKLYLRKGAEPDKDVQYAIQNYKNL
ncbi:MAG: hypothetical protein K8R21_15175, partial [Leptospira sp.]|nr:hypothetical protein [Leptospira sp.]